MSARLIGYMIAAIAWGMLGEGASAEVILLNLGGFASGGGLDVTASGAAASDGVLTNWNTISVANAGIATGAVIDSGGNVVSGVSIGTSAMALAGSSNGGTYASNGSAAGWIDLDVIERYFYNAGSGGGNIVFSGLSGAAYKVELLAIRSVGSDNDKTADYTANGVFADSTPNGDNFLCYTDGWLNGSVIAWNSVAPDAGSITINGERIPGGNFSYFNAVRISAVPEPAMVVLLGVGGLMMCGRRKI